MYYAPRVFTGVMREKPKHEMIRVLPENIADILGWVKDDFVAFIDVGKGYYPITVCGKKFEINTESTCSEDHYVLLLANKDGSLLAAGRGDMLVKTEYGYVTYSSDEELNQIYAIDEHGEKEGGGE